MSAKDASRRLVEPFPRIIHVANAVELLTALAFYGVYVNLGVYLLETVKLDEVAMGTLLGLFALGRAWLPVGVGALVDRLTFRRSLLLASALFTISYAILYISPQPSFARAAVLGIAVAGAFMKPVVGGTVVRYSPSGRAVTGFAIFYAAVSAGSVVGKLLAQQVRTHVSLRTTIITSVVASLCALALGWLLFFEKPGVPDASCPRPARIRGPYGSTLQSMARAIRQPHLTVFLVLVSGYFVLLDQFYQSLPVYLLRVLGESAPREYIMLTNPTMIVMFQVLVARLTRAFDPRIAIALGVFVGAGSMMTLGLFPSIAGAVGACALFAVGEMILSPHYFGYVTSFAAPGEEGFYMGLSMMPVGLGGLLGGVLAGRLLARYTPRSGHADPVAMWGTYAGIGAVCSLSLAVHAMASGRRRHPAT